MSQKVMHDYVIQQRQLFNFLNQSGLAEVGMASHRRTYHFQTDLHNIIELCVPVSTQKKRKARHYQVKQECLFPVQADAEI